VKNFSLFYLTILVFAWQVAYSQQHDEEATHSVVSSNQWTSILAINPCAGPCRSVQDAVPHPAELLAIKLINKAESSIDVALFSFSKANILKALLEADERGVKIRFISDRDQFKNLSSKCGTIGEKCEFYRDILQIVSPSSSDESPLQIYKRALEHSRFSKLTKSEQIYFLLKASHSESLVKIPTYTRMMHFKTMMIDHNILWQGSGNFSSTGMGVNFEHFTVYKAMYDTATNEKDERIQSFICALDELFEGEDIDFSTCNTETQFFSRSKNVARSRLVKLIRAAKESIDVSVHQLRDITIVKELAAAKDRGINLRILRDQEFCSNSQAEVLEPLMRLQTVFHCMFNNPRIYQMVHAKLAVFDSKVLWTGAGNWSSGGLKSNDEHFSLIDDPTIVGQVDFWFDDLWQKTRVWNYNGVKRVP